MPPRLIEDHSDGDLIQEIRSGDKKAFEIIFKRYRQKVYGRCLKMLGAHEQEAQDAVHDIFVDLWKKKVRGFRGDAAFSTWLFAVTSNHCLNKLRQKKELYPLNENFFSSADFHDAFAVEDCVREKLQSLGDSHREVISLVHFNGLSYEEAAATLQCPIGTIRSRLNRALEKAAPLLRECRESS